MSYSNYLNSNHWKETRKAVFRKKGEHCSICFSRKNIHVHHRFYTAKGKSVLWKEKIGTLYPLCAKCHFLVHKYHGLNFLRKSFFIRANNAVLLGFSIDHAIRFSFERKYYSIMIHSNKKKKLSTLKKRNVEKPLAIYY